MKPTYSELQDYLTREFCVGCEDRGEDDEGCESCPVGNVPTEANPDRDLEALAQAKEA